jgi:hypothetical protein
MPEKMYSFRDTFDQNLDWSYLYETKLCRSTLAPVPENLSSNELAKISSVSLHWHYNREGRTLFRVSVYTDTTCYAPTMILTYHIRHLWHAHTIPLVSHASRTIYSILFLADTYLFKNSLSRFLHCYDYSATKHLAVARAKSRQSGRGYQITTCWIISLLQDLRTVLWSSWSLVPIRLYEGASFSPDRLHNRPEAAQYLLTLVTACSDRDTHTLSKFS